jgi:dihydroorotate dehydrogenase
MEELLHHPLIFDPPLMNAAGTLGFAPDSRLPLDWEAFGAFITNPVSIKPRKPASGGRWEAYPGGAVLHSGFPNPGFRKVVGQYAAQWALSPLPVIVHLLADRPDELGRRVEHLETLENIQAVEIGFPDEISLPEIREVIRACVGEIALIARVPISRAIETGEASLEAGAAAISLAPPRGSLPTGKSAQSGRMYGPGVFPLALQAVRQLAAHQIPVIAAGGVYSRSQAEAMRENGAVAVQVDLAIWRGDWFVKET